MIKTLVVATGSVLFAGLGAVTAPAASADAVGSPCSDWMKISSDSNTGKRIFCAEAVPGDHDSPLTWLGPPVRQQLEIAAARRLNGYALFRSSVHLWHIHR